MARQGGSGGLTTLLALVAIGLIVAGIIYHVKGDSDEDQNTSKKESKPKVVTPTQHRTQPAYDPVKALGLGDGKLGSASSVKASDLGKATKVSGGVTFGGSGKSSKSSSSSRRSTSSSSSRPRSGG